MNQSEEVLGFYAKMEDGKIRLFVKYKGKNKEIEADRIDFVDFYDLFDLKNENES